MRPCATLHNAHRLRLSVPALLALTPSPRGLPRCWGANVHGQLGQGNPDIIGNAAGEVASLADVCLGAGRTAVQLAVGSSHNCVLLDDGLMYPAPSSSPGLVASALRARATCIGGAKERVGATSAALRRAPPLRSP